MKPSPARGFPCKLVNISGPFLKILKRVRITSVLWTVFIISKPTSLNSHDSKGRRKGIRVAFEILLFSDYIKVSGV